MTQQNNSTVLQAHTAMNAVRAAVDQLMGEKNTLEQRKKELEQRRSTLYKQPLGPAEAEQFMHELIDIRAARYVETLKNFELLDKLARPVDRTDRVDFGSNRRAVSLADVEIAHGRTPKGAIMEGLISHGGWKLPVFISTGESAETWPYFFFGDLMKERLSLVLQAQAAEIFGAESISIPSTLSALREEVATINKDLHELDQEIARLQADISGLTAPVYQGARLLSDTSKAAI